MKNGKSQQVVQIQQKYSCFSQTGNRKNSFKISTSRGEDVKVAETDFARVALSILKTPKIAVKLRYKIFSQPVEGKYKKLAITFQKAQHSTLFLVRLREYQLNTAMFLK